MMKKEQMSITKKESEKSILGSLLKEISWDGVKVKQYRNGGLGLENVLSTEVLQILYFLPRQHFLGEIIQALHIDNDAIKTTLYDEIEDTQFDLFPGDHYIFDDLLMSKNINVQPDAFLSSESVHALLELKRIKRGSFQKQQLGREFYLLSKQAKSKQPLLILIISQEPPILVSGEGRVNPTDSIKRTLTELFEHTTNHHLSLDEVIKQVDQSVAWITWNEIEDIIKRQMINYESENISEMKSIDRLCKALLGAIERHR